MAKSILAYGQITILWLFILAGLVWIVGGWNSSESPPHYHKHHHTHKLTKNTLNNDPSTPPQCAIQTNCEKEYMRSSKCITRAGAPADVSNCKPYGDPLPNIDQSCNSCNFFCNPKLKWKTTIDEKDLILSVTQVLDAKTKKCNEVSVFDSDGKQHGFIYLRDDGSLLWVYLGYFITNSNDNTGDITTLKWTDYKTVKVSPWTKVLD